MVLLFFNNNVNIDSVAITCLSKNLMMLLYRFSVKERYTLHLLSDN